MTQQHCFYNSLFVCVVHELVNDTACIPTCLQFSPPVSCSAAQRRKAAYPQWQERSDRHIALVQAMPPEMVLT